MLAFVFVFQLQCISCFYLQSRIGRLFSFLNLTFEVTVITVSYFLLHYKCKLTPFTYMSLHKLSFVPISRIIVGKKSGNFLCFSSCHCCCKMKQ